MMGKKRFFSLFCLFISILLVIYNVFELILFYIIRGLVVIVLFFSIFDIFFSIDYFFFVGKYAKVVFFRNCF